MASIKIVSAVNALLIVFYSVGALFYISDFEDVFNQFNAEIPMLTKIILASYRYWLLAVLIPMSIYIIVQKNNEIYSFKNVLLVASITMSVGLIVLLPTANKEGQVRMALT